MKFQAIKSKFDPKNPKKKKKRNFFFKKERKLPL